jgi:hypothetical protein
MKIYYWEENDPMGLYCVGGDTYPIKDKLKEELGASWAASRKLWLVPKNVKSLEFFRANRISKRFKVLREAFCHEPEANIYVTEDEIAKIGTEPFIKEVLIPSQFCGNCDSHYGCYKVEIKRL